MSFQGLRHTGLLQKPIQASPLSAGPAWRSHPPACSEGSSRAHPLPDAVDLQPAALCSVSSWPYPSGFAVQSVSPQP